MSLEAEEEMWGEISRNDLGRADAVAQFNLGHAQGMKAAHSGERFDVESDHPSYHAGLAQGLYSQPHPGPGAV